MRQWIWLILYCYIELFKKIDICKDDLFQFIWDVKYDRSLSIFYGPTAKITSHQILINIKKEIRRKVPFSHPFVKF